MIGEEHGGGGGSCLDNVVVQEELGAADVGVASSLNLLMTMPNMIAVGGTTAQQERWLSMLANSGGHVAGALNEPDVAGSELFCPVDDPSLGIRTRAERHGDGYVIMGSKAGWVSNGGVASTYLVFARTGFEAPAMASTSAFLVPADTPASSSASARACSACARPGTPTWRSMGWRSARTGAWAKRAAAWS